ncbi:MAG: Holliday junction resolvase RuvX [Candidatus Accumulibacter sp.]|jgi:putative Holliday junction resolvase|nr:Holliday junction resolvase RuvX [Accumulibacter sp.]
MPDSGPGALRRGTVLAFDFGTKRIGVAVGELELAQAHPLTTIHGERNDRRFSAIAGLIGEWKPVRLVVGLPVALDGAPHAMTARCVRFANQLRGRFGIEVDSAEERLSSVEAEERMRENGYNARDARERLDALAAQIILQTYFQRFSEIPSDSRHASSPSPSPAA